MDNSAVRQLLARRLSELKKTGNGITMAELSRQIDRNPAYLQQFIARGVPTELDENDRHKLAEILQLNPEDLKGPGRARKWNRSFDWRQTSLPQSMPVGPLNKEVYDLRRRDERIEELCRLIVESSNSHLSPGAGKSSHLLELLRSFLQSEDTLRSSRHEGFLPVYPLVEEGNTLRISIQRTLLPKEIDSNFSGDAYGVVIADDTMTPELRKGAIAIVDPKLDAKPHTTCIFRERDADRGGEVLVRRLYEISDETFKVYSYEHVANLLNKFERGARSAKHDAPLKLETLSRKSYPNCHVIVGTLSPPVT
ncbi:hypothetical protein [Bradyrhizobium sp. USDA 10063]